MPGVRGGGGGAGGQERHGGRGTGFWSRPAARSVSSSLADRAGATLWLLQLTELIPRRAREEPVSVAPRGGGIPRQRRASALTSFYPKEPSYCGSFVCDHVFIEHLLCARHRRHGRDGRDQSPLRPMGFAGRRTAAGRTGVCSLPRAWVAGPSSEPEPQPRVRRRLGQGSNGRNGEQGIPVGSRGRAGRVAGSSVRGAAGRHAHRRTSAPTELAAGSARRSPALGSRSPVCARETRIPAPHASHVRTRAPSPAEAPKGAESLRAAPRPRRPSRSALAGLSRGSRPGLSSY